MEDNSSRQRNLSQRFLQFAVDGIKLFGQMNKSYAEIHIAKQLTRSVTSCGADYEEASGAESKADFIHKLQIVLKELKGTQYWLKLLCKADLGEKTKIESFSCECNEPSRIIGKSIITSKRNVKSKRRL
ncbi:MAG: four helix bundle protein [Syntrophales bacterium]|jgi:four helix bundle protein